MAKVVYIVEGSTGEYSDFCSWIVKGFLDREKAETFALECQKEANTIEYSSKFGEPKHSLDKNFRIDYNGTTYRVFSLELEE